MLEKQDSISQRVYAKGISPVEWHFEMDGVTLHFWKPGDKFRTHCIGNFLNCNDDDIEDIVNRIQFIDKKGPFEIKKS